jgi:hypothetical protein
MVLDSRSRIIVSTRRPLAKSRRPIQFLPQCSEDRLSSRFKKIMIPNGRGDSGSGAGKLRGG